MCKVSIHFEACAVDNEWLWLSASDYNGLYKMNISTGNIKYCGEFPGEQSFKKRMHYGKALKIGNKIWFMPLEGSYIHVYDTVKEKFEWYQVSRGSAGVCAGVEFENKIYMISTRNMDILMFDILNNSVKKVYSDLRNEISGCAHGSCVYKQFLFSIARTSNILRQFNMQTHEIKELKLSEEKDKYEIIGIDNKNRLILSCSNKKIYKWDIEKKYIIPTDIIFEKKLNTWQNEGKIISNNYNDNKIYMLNIIDESILTINVQNLKLDKDPFIISSGFNYKDDILFVNKQDNCLYSALSGRLYPLCVKEEELEQKRVDIKNNEENSYEKARKENSVFRLREYIEIIVMS